MSASGAGNVIMAVAPGADDASGVTGPVANDNTKASGDTDPGQRKTANDDIARFITSVVPWPSEDKDLGFINLHWTEPGAHIADKPVWRGKPHRSVAEFVSCTKWLLNRPSTRDIYFCLSQQRRCKPDKHGQPKAVRSAAAAVALKAIWLDVDVKDPPKGYATLDEALAAVADFAKAAGLPKPSVLVGSGGGLHIYWTSKTPLTSDEWRRYAEGLKAAAMKYGLRCDLGVTTDAARVLRVPSTLNYKTDPPRPVQLLDLGNDYDFAVDLAQLAVPGTPKKTNGATNVIPFLNAKPAAAFAALDATESLADGLGYDNRPLDLAPLVADTGCGFIREAMATGGKDYAQPLWNLTTLVATFLEDGHALAHRMGNQHPGYNPETTDALWERKLHERKDRELGWPSCNAIQAAGCTDCITCPHLSKGKSPLHLTVPAAVTAPVANTSALLAANPIQAGVIDPAAFRVSFSNIRHRQWLYGVDLVRGDITIIASPGGAGKTSLAIGMTVCIATGKALLSEQIWGGGDLKALYISAEDSGTEMRRRVLAFCQKHNVAEQDISRLYVAGTDDPHVQRLSFLRTEKNASALNLEGFKQLDSLLVALRPDFVILDPLVALCGGGNTNDNAVMSLVMRELKSLAIKFDCTVLIVHHTRKGGGKGSDSAGEAEAISGAAAIVNLARRAIMPVTMTDTEAKAFGVLPSERRQYFKLVDAKSNLAPLSADAPWYELANEELPNAEPPTYPNGDRVQAVKRAQLTRSKASSLAGPDQQTIRFEILKLIDRGLTIDGEKVPYSPNSTGNNKQRAFLADAMAAVERVSDREYSPRDLRAVAEREVEVLKHEGWVTVEPIKKGRFRRRHGLKVVWERTPWAKERENLHQHGGPTVRTEEEEQELDRIDIEKGLEG